MASFLRWLCGYLCIHLNGRQINRFFNLCARNGIELWNITSDIERMAKANIRLKDIYLIRPFLKKTKTHFRITKKKGFPFWCYRHKWLKWLLVIVPILSALYFNSLSYIWDVQISGNNQISTSEILELISADELIGKKRNSINCTDIEYQLREEYNDMGWVSVFTEHTTLYISIKESLYDAYVFEEEDTIQRYDYITPKDAKIYSIVTRNGTSLVKKGDVVKAGDVLVEGQYKIFDDNGLLKGTLSVKADALVYGDVSYDYMGFLTEMELLGAKIGGEDLETAIQRLSFLKFNQFLEKLEKNGVKILAKRVMIEQNENQIFIKGRITAREEIGKKIPVEEQLTHEFE